MVHKFVNLFSQLCLSFFFCLTLGGRGIFSLFLGVVLCSWIILADIPEGFGNVGVRRETQNIWAWGFETVLYWGCSGWFWVFLEGLRFSWLCFYSQVVCQFLDGFESFTHIFGWFFVLRNQIIKSFNNFIFNSGQLEWSGQKMQSRSSFDQASAVQQFPLL